jgi:RNA polymerase sigma-70 factor (ECF subfamily)
MHSLKDQDPKLITDFKLGKKQAFNILVLKYQYRILKLIKMYITDDHESLDLRQEIFLKAYKGLENFREESAFYTWLHKIATNTVKSYLIEKNRHLSEFSLESLNIDKCYMIFKNHENPEDILNNSIAVQELNQILNVAVKKLPFILKNTIFLREVDNLSYEEIASIMKCPVGTVRSRIFRAREALEKYMKFSMESKDCKDFKHHKIYKKH